MKKLAILSMIFLLAISVLQIQAQEVKKETVKKEIKETKKAIKETKKELKTERKELRKLEGSDVGVVSKNSFYADFGDLSNVKWRRSEYFDEATFTKDGNEMTAFYDSDGKLVGTTSLKKFADLPAKAQKEIKAKYKDYSVEHVVMFDDNELNETDMLLYNIQFADEDNYFVELTETNNKIVVRVNTLGDVIFFKKL